MSPANAISQNYAVSPISRLPEDVLINIFEVLVAWRKFSDGNLHGNEKRFNIILTHVCRVWRDLAINYSDLWSCIDDFNRPDVVKTFLARSSAVPLHVYFVSDDLKYRPTGRKLLGLTLSHISRISTLYIDSDYGVFQTSHWSSINAKLQTSAPILERLVLINDYAGPSSEPLMWEEVFGCSAPRLLLLELRGYGTIWRGQSSIAKGLTSLNLSFVNHTYMPTVLEILEILANSPNLKEIILNHAVSSMHEHVDIPVIELPQLSSLQLTGIDFFNTVQLCKPINCSESLIWDININDGVYPLYEPVTIVPAHSNYMKEAHCEKLSFDLHYNQMTLNALLNPFDHNKQSLVLGTPEARSLYNLNIVLKHTFWTKSEKVDLNIRNLSQSQDFSTTDEEWKDFFSIISSTRCLKVEFPRYGLLQRTVQTFLSAMMTLEENRRLNANCYGAQITELELVFPSRDFNISNAREDEKFLLSLKECLRFRERCGTRLHCLRIFSRDDIQEFTELTSMVERMVDHFVWDTQDMDGWEVLKLMNSFSLEEEEEELEVSRKIGCLEM